MNKSVTHLETHIQVTHAGATAVALLATETGLSKQRIKQAMQKGAVWLTQKNFTRRLRRATRQLPPDATLHLYYDESLLATEPAAPTLIEDLGDYSVWDKPCGLLSQGSKWGDHCAINRWVELHLEPQRPAFVVHRLDRAANGLILIAHGKKSAAALCSLFEQRAVEKHYRVRVHGHFSQTLRPMKIEAEIDGKPAVSLVSLLQYDAHTQQSLLDVSIETGRKHQIRRHLAALGHPVVGDRLYGRGNETIDLQLTACSLSFVCPVQHEQRYFQLDDKRLPGFTPAVTEG